MKIIYNNILPPKRFSAINIFGVILARHGTNISDRTIRHESIHTKQMKGMLYVFFYLWYGIEWLFRLIQYRDAMRAYYNISFEREAYANHNDVEYLNKMCNYSWIKYM